MIEPQAEPAKQIAERLASTTAEKLPAKHFLQEDQYDALADAIHRIAS